MSDVLVASYPEMFMLPPLVEIGGGWLGVAQQAVEELRALHPEVRISAMYRDRHGMLAIDVGVAPLARDADVIDAIQNIVAEFDTDLLDAMLSVVGRYRLLSAWTCYDDGKPGWLVDPPNGRRPLCRTCQRQRGLKGVPNGA
ncbi:hypothetical protein GHL01_00560 [Sinorhizobium meliloti]|uniref:hypothetical protein n=1 Tax=Rhizobium meliloti TaxID=382 RepID=UPI001295FABE|nr:hypothetical protein [Sinorhizobium meliloti]MQV12237.1 hypothetical protein [Sinorhizobium meliloti]